MTHVQSPRVPNHPTTRRQPSNRPAGPPAEAEALLREMAFVCRLTERVKAALLAERAATPAAV
jgi:hypothetical protein